MPLPNREGMVSSSGRILKGRGNMKYRTPPPSEVDNKSSTHIYIFSVIVFLHCSILLLIRTLIRRCVREGEHIPNSQNMFVLTGVISDEGVLYFNLKTFLDRRAVSPSKYRHHSHRRRSISPYKLPRRRSARDDSREDRLRRSPERTTKHRRRYSSPYDRKDSSRSELQSGLRNRPRSTQFDRLICSQTAVY